MRYTVANEQPLVYVVVFETGDDVLTVLASFAGAHKITAAHFSGIGAFINSEIAYFDLNIHDYIPIQVNEQVEVLSFLGNISMYKEEPKIHTHVVLGRVDGSTIGGHLLHAVVRPTLELMITVLDTKLIRRMDEATKIPLIKL